MTHAELSLVRAIERIDAASREYLAMHWWQHDVEDCPADETCQCPVASELSAALSDASEVARTVKTRWRLRG